jgi:hypothetical protein
VILSQLGQNIDDNVIDYYPLQKRGGYFILSRYIFTPKTRTNNLFHDERKHIYDMKMTCEMVNLNIILNTR